MKTVNQPSLRPTNKLLTSALVGSAANEIWGNVMVDVYPQVAGAETSMLVGAVAALGAGYFIKDRPNVVVPE